jgi:hypothetical protein
VRVAALKLPGVESIDVSLERAVAEIRLRAGNTITLAQIREIVRKNGFTPKDATVTVVGNLTERGGKPALSVSGTAVVLLLAPDPKLPTAYEELENRRQKGASTALQVTGAVQTRVDQPDVLVVRSASAVGS